MIFIPNLILYVKVPGQNLTLDMETGNLITSHDTLEIKAFMKPRSPQRDAVMYSLVEYVPPSVDRIQVYLSGYCVSPKIIPGHILLHAKQYMCAYTEPISNTIQNGKFTLRPQVNKQRPRVAKALNRAIGTHIEGMFEFAYGN
jgi:hypothetical protein